MQLKLKRSQQMKGLISKSAHFEIGFRVQFTPEEKALIEKYKLGDQVLAEINLTGEENQGWHLTCNAAERGSTVSCKSVGALQKAESSIRGGCEQLKTYLAVAETFDGREVVHEF